MGGRWGDQLASRMITVPNRVFFRVEVKPFARKSWPLVVVYDTDIVPLTGFAAPCSACESLGLPPINKRLNVERIHGALNKEVRVMPHRFPNDANLSFQ